MYNEDTRGNDRLRNRNNRYQDGGNSAFKSFMGQAEALPTLGIKAENLNQNTGAFIKKLVNYVIVTFKEPGILSRAVAEPEDSYILQPE